jgi:hypothetical protein
VLASATGTRGKHGSFRSLNPAATPRVEFTDLFQKKE